MPPIHTSVEAWLAAVVYLGKGKAVTAALACLGRGRRREGKIQEKEQEAPTSAFPRKSLPFPQVTSFLSFSFSLEHNVLLPDMQGGKRSTLQDFLNPPNFPHCNNIHTEAGYPLNCSCCSVPSSREGSTLVKSPFNLHLYQTAGAAAENCHCCHPGNWCPKAH